MQRASDDLPILFVDDEHAILRALERTAQASGWAVVACDSPQRALELISEREFGVVVSDFRMPGMDGVDFLMRVRERWPRTERILLTAFADEDALERGINDAGISRFLRKPWKRDMLLEALDNALQESRLRRENAVLLHRVKNRNDELNYLNELLKRQVEESDRTLYSFRRRWDAALNAIVDPVVIVGSSYKLEGGNAAAARLAGLPVEELEGRACYEALYQRQSPCPECPLQAGSCRMHVSHGGAKREIDARAYKLPGEDGSHLCVYRDVTHEAQLEREVTQMDKLAAIGRLASGVAHEINNPLTGILSFVQLAQKADVAPDKLARYHEVIRECAVRCRDIVQSLRDFSRQAKSTERAPFDLNLVCERALVLFAGTGDREIEWRPNSGGALVSGNGSQITQVLVNLVHNALDAAPEGGRVRVAIESDASEWIVAVEDDGPGVPEEELSKIFEPFYTTKEPGKGTGLGLAISHNIMREHGGSIRVLRAALGGARFEARLPRSTASATTHEQEQTS